MDTTEEQLEEDNADEKKVGPGSLKKKKGGKRKQRNLEDLKADKENLEDENKSLKDEIRSLRKEKKDLKDSYESLLNENKKLENEKELLSQELTNVKEKLVDCGNQCENWKIKNEQMFHRLSEVVSHQITNTNPLIQDINYRDQSRQIAEVFRAELYNKQWGDAFDVLNTVNLPERDILEILRDICRDSYLICSFVLTGQADTLRKALYPFDTKHHSLNNSAWVSTDALKDLPEVVRDEFIHSRRQFKDFEKILQEQCCNSLATKRLVGTYGEDIIPRMKSYIYSCIQISWDMLLQKPPIYLDFDMVTGCQIDPEVCGVYSYRGSTVEYMVWPVVYHHHGGPVLMKGIVQAFQQL
ncbi:uncharacterized protein LOC132557173 [Ylistrum balloti]|uniref:uncharacterized protein LOC132557173 n=1 Tax=Ylistrum balloti TaxID=509963 RepID=UPI002905D518|nr:uncharacterized protein LOC132557173 [Ylistrum balloti]